MAAASKLWAEAREGRAPFFSCWPCPGQLWAAHHARKPSQGTCGAAMTCVITLCES